MAASKTKPKETTKIGGKTLVDKASGKIISAGPEEIDATQPLARHPHPRGRVAARADRVPPRTSGGCRRARRRSASGLGAEPGDITTIEDEASVEEARQAWREMREAMAPGGPAARAGSGVEARP